MTLLAVNIEPSQDGSAVELFKRRGYTFTSLRMPDPNWNQLYDVNEAPTNILIDGEGRGVVKLTFASPEERAMAAREIELLAARTVRTPTQ
jgi:hypothetical protein